ncbi:hypothetical protein [Nocardioides donggukensis]|uniref:Right-handed parallel beta-helix repeat-containing protein n=1 Tax=Nocardioides donggukensis TaxID=2774019 RepID=A0A927K5U3_9ACTN|nr:hypothetical protein [Nocardioides donggukensis]MBD8868391.1 hypothetical protein [Nocardioides donggukensis]
MRKRSFRTVAGGAAGVLALSAAAVMSPAQAAATTYEVRTEAQLRAAVVDANENPGADRIVLRASITFGSSPEEAIPGPDGPQTGDLDVTDELTVLGSGKTIDANGVDRVFDVTGDVALTLQGLVLRGGAPALGESGGAVRSTGSLVVRDSVAVGNAVEGAGASGGALFNDGGTLLVEGSILKRNAAVRAGGAIEANAGTTRVLGSRLVNNSAGPTPGNGGGLHLTGEGRVEVTDSDVLRNTATAEGGGLWNSAAGTFVVLRSEVRGNVAEGAEATNGGGGLFNDGGFLNVRRSLVQGNSATGASGSGGGVLNDAGRLRLGRSTVRDNEAERAGGGIETNAGTVDLRRTDLIRNEVGANPGNGGGLHVSGAGVVDYVRGTVFGNYASLEGGGLWNSAGGRMLLDYVDVEENVADGDDSDNGGGGLYNDGGFLKSRHSSISGNSASGAAGSGGGVLNNGGFLRLGRTTLRANDAQRAGGGIETNSGPVSLRRTDLVRNEAGTAPGNGGGLHVTGRSKVTYIHGAVVGNRAGSEGGGLWNSVTGEMRLEDLVVRGNVAEGDDATNGGGGLFNDGGFLNVLDSKIKRNSATGASGSGGGVFNEGGLLWMGDTVLRQNDAERAGGGIETNAGEVTLEGVDMFGNTAGDNPGNGGGLHVSGNGRVDYDGGTVTNNAAANEGGGLWNSAVGTIRTTGVTIRGNTAPVGPNVFNQPPGGTFTVDGTPIPPGDNDFSN